MTMNDDNAMFVWGMGALAGCTGPTAYSTPSTSNSINWYATSVCVVPPFMSVTASRSVDLDDDIVVSEYEED